MKLVNTISKEIVAEINTNHRMSVEDAIAIMDGEIYEDKDIWDENVLINDEWYFYDDLALVLDEQYAEILVAGE